MTSTSALLADTFHPHPSSCIAGDPGAVLLAGPPAAAGPAGLAAHRAVWGTPATDRSAIIEAITSGDLRGRGGGQFPVARKIRTVREAATRTGLRPLVVVNASESEPASRKDRTLVELRPHLVLDGAAACARAVGALEVVVHLHRGRPEQERILAAALAERARDGHSDPQVRVSVGPDRYVSGEASSIVRLLEGGPAQPRSTAEPLAARGLHGRPTLVQNAETVAHVAALVRWGAHRWHEAGPARHDGPLLLTLHGDVAEPGLVVEITGPATIGGVLRQRAGLDGPPAALLVGGYAGRWASGERAWDLPLDRASMQLAGLPLGCGLLACLPSGACPVRETARLTRWLAGESAGQCGPCILGLPSLADVLERLARGRCRRRDAQRLQDLFASVVGRGACRHPDGVATLVTSMMAAFPHEVGRHAAGQPCGDTEGSSCLPLPSISHGWT